MRSQTFLRRSHQLLHSSQPPHPALLSLTRASCSRPNLLVPRNSVSSTRLSSSTPPQPPSSLPESPAEPPEPIKSTPETPLDDVEKVKSRRSRVTATSSEPPETADLPSGLDILWLPGEDGAESGSSRSAALPPPDIFEEALNNLLITLHPQTQHQAAYPTASGKPNEPTLGLYCPIEGGDYVLDATVRELARRTGSEVLVLDSVQLAAGEWGQFGKAANSLQLPRNPLHFPSATPPQASTNQGAGMLDDDDEPENGLQMFPTPQQMTLTVLTPSTIQGRTVMSSRRNVPPTKIKVFFDTLVNSPVDGASSEKRPRLIYIRDFPTLAPSSAIWYPHLVSAVRERRRGPLSRPSSVVANPMTIIFGMTPSLIPSAPADSSSGGNLMNLLMSRTQPSPQASFGPKPGRIDWNEDEISEKAREKRLQDRLRKWEKSDSALHEELPRLANTQESEGSDSRKPEIIVIGGGSGGIPGLPPFLGGPSFSGSSESRGSDSENRSSFFRTSILVPSTRSPVQEKATRVARRREINELTMRMGIGAVGGRVESGGAAIVNDIQPKVEMTKDDKSSSPSDQQQMWEDWGNRIEVWSNVRTIADRAIGAIMSSRTEAKSEKPTLDPTAVPWSTVRSAWAAQKSSREKRKLWMKEASPVGKTLREDLEGDTVTETQNGTDELVERLKNDADLGPHEQRLLPCIVDSASMPTSFSQVYLPPHTIDSVRTIVSLPLLHPHAFQQGILKEHGMTGCLLFGPPGTGKTLVVRALAKEAGCRMITISPSDVMDMYVGEGEKLVRAVFSLARRLSPCVVFLDEIDALFGARMSARESGGAIAHRGVITEFMQEMDGLKSSREDSVIVIGATNRPFDLDDAVLRRLPRRLLVDLPGEKEREEILKILLRGEILAADVDIKDLAKTTESFSGSDLKHLCVSAALDSVKETVHLPWATSSSIPPSTIPVPKNDNKDSPDHSVAHTSASETAESEAIPSTPDIERDAESSSMTESIKLSESAENLEVAEAVISQLPARVLHPRNFTKALKEITPSSSESLGSLSELRKWNEEFGEGRRDRKKRQVWGKGRFGFVEHRQDGFTDGRVVNPTAPPATAQCSHRK